jgi:hypothetical protein
MPEHQTIHDYINWSDFSTYLVTGEVGAGLLVATGQQYLTPGCWFSLDSLIREASCETEEVLWDTLP